MELFRNVRIRARITLTNLMLVALVALVFVYIRWMNLEIHIRVFLFLVCVFLALAVFSSLLVASSIVRPIERIVRRLESFNRKKTANPLIDDGSDELADVAEGLNVFFNTWKSEMANIAKKRSLSVENEAKIETVRTDLERQLRLTRSCLDVARLLNTTFDFQTNLRTILDEAIRTVNVQWASILIINRETLELSVVCLRGMEQTVLDDLAEENYPSIRLKPSEGLAGNVIKGGVPLIANKGHKDSRFKKFSDVPARDERIASILCAPIVGTDGTMLGVMNFINRISPPLFRNEDIPYTQDICTLVALVIERHRLYRRLFKDEATGLISYSVWQSCLSEETSRAIRYSQPLSAVIIEMDSYGKIKSQTNHEFVRNIHIEVGKVVKAALRDSDLAAKANDRFYMLLPNTDAAGAVFLVGRIRERLARMSFDYKGTKLTVTASFGIASYPEKLRDARNLVKSAARALKQARADGGNRATICGVAQPDDISDMSPESE